MLRRSRSNSRVVIGDSEVVKEFPSGGEIEFAKLRELHRVASISKFRSPQPISFKGDSVVMTRLGVGSSIRVQFIESMCADEIPVDSTDLFYETGRVLAEIHKNASLPHTADWVAPPLFRNELAEWGIRRVDDLPSALLHGDYGFNNLETVNGSDLLTVFDPSPNYFTTFAANEVGPIYVDLGNFVAGMHGLLPLGVYRSKPKWSRRHCLISAVVSGYESVSDLRIDDSILDAFARASAQCYFAAAYGKLLRYPAMLMLFGTWKN